MPCDSNVQGIAGSSLQSLNAFCPMRSALSGISLVIPNAQILLQDAASDFIATLRLAPASAHAGRWRPAQTGFDPIPANI